MSSVYIYWISKHFQFQVWKWNVSVKRKMVRSTQILVVIGCLSVTKSKPRHGKAWMQNQWGEQFFPLFLIGDFSLQVSVHLAEKFHLLRVGTPVAEEDTAWNCVSTKLFSSLFVSCLWLFLLLSEILRWEVSYLCSALSCHGYFGH